MNSETSIYLFILRACCRAKEVCFNCEMVWDCWNGHCLSEVGWERPQTELPSFFLPKKSHTELHWLLPGLTETPWIQIHQSAALEIVQKLKTGNIAHLLHYVPVAYFAHSIQVKHQLKQFEFLNFYGILTSSRADFLKGSGCTPSQVDLSCQQLSNQRQSLHRTHLIRFWETRLWLAFGQQSLAGLSGL